MLLGPSLVPGFTLGALIVSPCTNQFLVPSFANWSESTLAALRRLTGCRAWSSGL